MQGRLFFATGCWSIRIGLVLQGAEIFLGYVPKSAYENGLIYLYGTPPLRSSYAHSKSFPSFSKIAGGHAEETIGTRRVRGLFTKPNERRDQIEQFFAIQIGPCISIGLCSREERCEFFAGLDARSERRGQQVGRTWHPCRAQPSSEEHT